MISLFLEEDKIDYDILKEFWKTNVITTNFTKRWRKTIHDGYLKGTENSNKIPANKTSKSPYSAFNKKLNNLEITGKIVLLDFADLGHWIR